MTHLGGSIWRCYRPIGLCKLAGLGQGHPVEHSATRIRERISLPLEEAVLLEVPFFTGFAAFWPFAGRQSSKLLYVRAYRGLEGSVTSLKKPTNSAVGGMAVLAPAAGTRNRARRPFFAPWPL